MKRWKQTDMAVMVLDIKGRNGNGLMGQELLQMKMDERVVIHAPGAPKGAGSMNRGGRGGNG